MDIDNHFSRKRILLKTDLTIYYIFLISLCIGGGNKLHVSSFKSEELLENVPLFLNIRPHAEINYLYMIEIA